MIIKLIDCVPVEDKEDAFSRSQEAWSAISNCDGLRAQFGGWDRNSSHAVILGLWENQSSIDLFMRDRHDEITENIGQHLTYEKCSVSYLSVEMPMSTEADMADLIVSDISVVRMADCRLYPGGQKQFLADQESVWNPGMSDCPGMLGGYVARFLHDQDRFMVITCWDSERSHQDYVTNKYPSLRGMVDIDSYAKELNGYQIVLNRAWDVIPGQPIHGDGQTCP